jgi:hypothetical protein
LCAPIGYSVREDLGIGKDGRLDRNVREVMDQGRDITLRWVERLESGSGWERNVPNGSILTAPKILRAMTVWPKVTLMDKVYEKSLCSVSVSSPKIAPFNWEVPIRDTKC